MVRKLKLGWGKDLSCVFASLRKEGYVCMSHSPCNEYHVYWMYRDGKTETYLVRNKKSIHPLGINVWVHHRWVSFEHIQKNLGGSSRHHPIENNLVNPRIYPLEWKSTNG